jgi:hypothetical protein
MPKVDGLVKTRERPFCHSRENGNPGNPGSSGLPLPACAGTGFAGETTMGTYHEIIKAGKENQLQVTSNKKEASLVTCNSSLVTKKSNRLLLNDQ